VITRIGRLVLCLAILACQIAVADPVRQAQSDGLRWLVASVLPEGGFDSLLSSGTALQNTAEVVLALDRAGVLTAQQRSEISAYISSIESDDAESVARLAMLVPALGITDERYLLDLDRHIGTAAAVQAQSGIAADVLPIAWLLLAARSAQLPSDRLLPLLELLLQRQHSSGGWGDYLNPPSLYPTALVLLALHGHRHLIANPTPLDQASDFLLAELGAVSWQASTEQLAALLVLVMMVEALPYDQAWLTHLLDAQGDDGSWRGDVLATALAVRVLAAVDAEPQAQPAGLSLQLVDADTGLPLPRARLQLTGPFSASATSAADGRVRFDGLPPGHYQLQLMYTGRATRLVSVDVNPAEHHELGRLSLYPLVGQATIEGVVRRADTGVPLANAPVSIVAAQEQHLTTDLNGAFSEAVPPGLVTVAVSASGFKSVTATLPAFAGQVVRVPIALRSDAEPPETGLPILRGRLLDADTGLPVAAASIVTELGIAISDGAGRFVLEHLAEGVQRLGVSVPGYVPLQMDLLVPAEAILDVGDLRLLPEIRAGGLLFGRVSASPGNGPLYGAVLRAAGQTTSSSMTGDYSLMELSQTTFALDVSAIGYQGKRTTILLPEGQTLRWDIALEPAARGGVVPDLHMEADEYGAYDLVGVSALLHNSNSADVTISLFAEIRDEQDRLVDQFMVAADPAVGSFAVTLPADAMRTVPVVWNTGHVAPGHYYMVVRVHDQSGLEVWARSRVDFRVRPERAMPGLRISVDPGYAVRGDERLVQYRLTGRNMSNVVVALQLQFQLLNPEGIVLDEQAVSLNVAPATRHLSEQLASAVIGLGSPGEYPLEIRYASGTDDVIVAGLLHVSPDIHIDVEQAITPSSVLPHGDNELQLHIRIHAREGRP
jgi:hypothetical protein